LERPLIAWQGEGRGRAMSDAASKLIDGSVLVFDV
jgi:hypothetical protein